MLVDPVRVRILAQLREPESAAGVARALGLPRQRVGYHIRELEKARLLRFVGERRRGNTVEHLLQTTATSYVVGPRALGAMATDAGTVRDRFSSAYLIAAASRTINDVGVLRERAREAGRQLPTLTLEGDVRFSSPEQQRAFADDLTEAFVALVAKYHDDATPRGRRFRVVISGHPVLPPDPTRTPSST
jgi:DNA-binding transcriptional ArsR family regulator